MFTVRPLRQKTILEVTHDPYTGHERILRIVKEEDVLSDEGSIDSTSMQQKIFLDCGCDAEIGGRCHECGAISCRACFGHCQNCQKPLCMQHSNFLETKVHGVIRLCNKCHDVIVRKHKLKRIFQFVVSPFVEFEKE